MPAPRSLATIAYANGFVWHHHRTSDRMADVLSPGYFDWTHLNQGDKITISIVGDRPIDVWVASVGGPGISEQHTIVLPWDAPMVEPEGIV